MYSSNHGLSIAHLNVRSLLGDYDNFLDFFQSNLYNIFCVTETWLQDCLDIPNIPGYDFFRVDRTRNQGRGGGIGMFVSDSMKSTLLSSISYVNDNIESIWINLSIGAKKISVGSIYRPINSKVSKFVDELNDILTNVFPTADELICLGDFNVNFLNARNPVLTCTDSFGLAQLIETPTRVTKHSSSLLDPIFISNRELVLSSGVVETALSDHSLTYCEVNLRVNKKHERIIEVRNFQNFEQNDFHRDLENLDWRKFLYEPDIDTKVSILSEYILYCFDKHAPLKKIKTTKPRAPWLTQNTRLLMRERDTALKKYKKTQSSEDWNYYKTLRNATLSTVRAEKKAYIQSISNNKLNSKTLWTCLGDIGAKQNKKNKKIPPELKDPNKICSFFSSVCKVRKNHKIVNNASQTRLRNSGSSFRFTMIDSKELSKIIQEMHSTSRGTDNISIFMLKLCTPVIDKYLVHLINSCIEKSKFPSAWKTALTIPVPKINNPNSLNDLRPISLLCTLSKIFEKVIHQQLIHYIKENDILPEKQSGFRRSHSSGTALADVVGNIISLRDRGLAVALVLLDFSKAFDTIDHQILLTKLRLYGIEESAINVFRDYLTERKQIVKVDDRFSELFDLSAGVPQGSILGPLLFILYTADIFNTVEYCDLHCFADDTQIYLAFKPDDYVDAMRKINADLQNILNWSEHHNLELNSSKCKYMVFGPSVSLNLLNDSFRIWVGDEELDRVDANRNLGVIMDNKLKFTLHVNKLLQRSFLALKLLYINRKFLDANLRKHLCESLVLSNFNYGIYVYGTCLDSFDRSRIQKLQNRCCRFVLNLPRFSRRISDDVGRLGWLSMGNRIEAAVLSLTHNILLTGSPGYLRKHFIIRSQMSSNHHLRNHCSLHLPKYNTTLFRKSFVYNAIKLYNALPLDYKNLPVAGFRTKVKELLICSDLNR